MVRADLLCTAKIQSPVFILKMLQKRYYRDEATTSCTSPRRGALLPQIISLSKKVERVKWTSSA
jgi:hypothetical protein